MGRGEWAIGEAMGNPSCAKSRVGRTRFEVDGEPGMVIAQKRVVAVLRTDPNFLLPRRAVSSSLASNTRRA